MRLLSLFRKKKKVKAKSRERRAVSNTKVLEVIKRLSEQLKKHHNFLVNEHHNKMPDILINKLVEPLKEALSSNQALKQKQVKRLSVCQAEKPKSLDNAIEQLKGKLDMLNQRHINVLNCLGKNRGNWLTYSDIATQVGLSPSCIRGYVSDLIKTFQLPIEKKRIGKEAMVKLSDKAFKQIAITKLSA